MKNLSQISVILMKNLSHFGHLRLAGMVTSILFADDTSCFIEGTDLSDMCIQLSTEMNKLISCLRQTGYLSMYQKQIA